MSCRNYVLFRLYVNRREDTTKASAKLANIANIANIAYQTLLFIFVSLVMDS